MDAADKEPPKGRPVSRNEISALLRLYFALGAGVAAGIVLCFLGGLWLDRRFEWGGKGVLGGVLVGFALSLYWGYLRIAAHLREYAPEAFADPDDPPDKENDE